MDSTRGLRVNEAFVGVTRSRTWCTVTGVESEGITILEEAKRVSAAVSRSNPEITFEIPDPKKINEVPLREVWEHEEQDFTPWLLENVDQLASLIGIKIDDVNRETVVGDYTADLAGTEPTTRAPVVIENQFGSTDHDHLGKLLTYAAGIDAEFVVWVAEGFRDEHRSVLDWLNTRNSSGARFFGVRPRTVSVGTDDATLGFEFTVVVEPNDWERELRDPLSDILTGIQYYIGIMGR
ncbi:hypothetical protein D8Y22_15255 [Salinadaptatus halalkaliphilus]|uniref:Uncharacterized protein n=1 Tax=Salinadaptatus halalkaliphilus TaxID=2419781 RepID=A0A4S3TIU4_9EURY|nr:hypothetical protein [Salinadaptatus halalkaliphilus]THE63994.1 hypothetical protein D8Y22_15255 [Salinadaptatus halalkaliphilus]